MKFDNGVKVLDDGTRVGIRQSKTNLSSNGVTKYTTILWKDGTASCDCPGWTQRVKSEGMGRRTRECKHTKAMPVWAPWMEAALGGATKKPTRGPTEGPPARSVLTVTPLRDIIFRAGPTPQQQVGFDAARAAGAKLKPVVIDLNDPKQTTLPGKRATIRFDDEEI
jgi:hypothetical protein